MNSGDNGELQTSAEDFPRNMTLKQYGEERQD